MAVTVGVGFTVKVKTISGPTQPLDVGVTVIVAVTGVVPALMAVNEGRPPGPLAARPMVVLLFVQAKVVPVTGPVKLSPGKRSLLHSAWLATGSTLGVGYTVIWNTLVLPVHPLAVGTIDTVAVISVVPVFTAVKAGIVLVPPAIRPMAGVLLVQVNKDPDTGPARVMAAVIFPLHTEKSGTALAEGVGNTVIVKDFGLPLQPFAVGVIVMVAIRLVVPGLVAVNDRISPLPVAARLMAVLSLAHAYVVPGIGPVKAIREVDDWLQTVISAG